MGEAADSIRPIWRTRLAAALVAWMGLVVGATLASSRLLEVLPPDVLPFAAVSLYLTPIPIFLVWGFWAMLREPLTGWVAPTVVLAFCGAFVPAAKPLFEAGVALNFAARRPAYEAIVDDVTSGRLAAAPGEIGWTQGRRGEIRYAFQSTHRDLVQFIWSENPYLPSAVIYDGKSCGVPRAEQRRRIISSYDRHLGGHYCYVREFP